MSMTSSRTVPASGVPQPSSPASTARATAAMTASLIVEAA
jgi:hypothetical protein